MKKSALLFVFVFSSIFGLAQDIDETPPTGSNDLQFNVLNLLTGTIGLSYGHVLSDDTSIGINMNKAIDYDATFIRLFTIAPYYRIYFGNRRAAGFFFETNFTLYRNKTEILIGSNNRDESDSEVGAGLGIGIGGKFLARNGFVLDIYGGMGRALNDVSDTNKIFGSLGVCIGKRF